LWFAPPSAPDPFFIEDLFLLEVIPLSTALIGCYLNREFRYSGKFLQRDQGLLKTPNCLVNSVGSVSLQSSARPRELLRASVDGGRPLCHSPCFHRVTHRSGDKSVKRPDSARTETCTKICHGHRLRLRGRGRAVLTTGHYPSIRQSVRSRRELNMCRCVDGAFSWVSCPDITSGVDRLGNAFMPIHRESRHNNSTGITLSGTGKGSYQVIAVGGVQRGVRRTRARVRLRFNP